MRNPNSNKNDHIKISAIFLVSIDYGIKYIRI